MMADGVVLPGTGQNIASEEVSTLNGSPVSAQQVQRVALVGITADGIAIDLGSSGAFSVESTSSTFGGGLTPKFAFANVAASQTDSAIVAAVASKKIRVLALYAVAGGTATDLTFNSKPGGAGSAKSAKFANGANGGEVLPFSPVGWFETVSGEGLSVTTGAGSTTGIGVVYIEV